VAAYDLPYRDNCKLDSWLAGSLDSLRATWTAGFVAAAFLLRRSSLAFADFYRLSIGLVFIIRLHCYILFGVFGTMDGQPQKVSQIM